jgi:hypothetical protein
VFWLLAECETAATLVDFFYGVNQARNAIEFCPNFARHVGRMAEENEALLTELKSTDRFKAALQKFWDAQDVRRPDRWWRGPHLVPDATLEEDRPQSEPISCIDWKRIGVVQSGQSLAFDYGRFSERVKGGGDYDVSDPANLLRKDQKPDLDVMIRRVLDGFRFLADLTEVERVLTADAERMMRKEAEALIAALTAVPA